MAEPKKLNKSFLLGIAAIIITVGFFVSTIKTGQPEKQKEKSMTSRTSDATFNNDVLTSKVPVMVDFWAPWCAPCRLVGPIIDKISNDASGKYAVYKLNVDENPKTASAYSITGIPSVLIFKNGVVVQQLVGAQSEESYRAALTAALQ